MYNVQSNQNNHLLAYLPKRLRDGSMLLGRLHVGQVSNSVFWTMQDHALREKDNIIGGGHDDHMTTLLHAVHQREKLGHDTSLHLSMSLLEHMYGEASGHCMLIVMSVALNNSYLTVILVHEMHGWMHQNHCQITNLLAHDPLSSLAYPMFTNHMLSTTNRAHTQPSAVTQLPRQTGPEIKNIKYKLMCKVSKERW